jgi:hypothetical protein
VRVSPRTRVIPTGVRLLPLGALLLLAACGEPPQPLPKSPPQAAPSSAPVSLGPSFPLGNQSLPPVVTFPPGQTFPTYPTPTLNSTAGTSSPTPTPSHAARCTGSPTGTEIIAMLRRKSSSSLPSGPLAVLEGPFCSGTWSFTRLGLSGEADDQDEALMVMATGKGSTLGLVAAGSDVCTPQVETQAPPGIRVLACGF